MRANCVFLRTPSQVVAGEAPQDSAFSLGGMVEKGSVHRAPEAWKVQLSFVTDFRHELPVRYDRSLLGSVS